MRRTRPRSLHTAALRSGGQTRVKHRKHSARRLGACTRVTRRLTVRSGRAGAGEAVDEVDAGPSVEARPGVALVHIVLTVHPLVAGLALQRETRGELVVRFGCR